MLLLIRMKNAYSKVGTCFPEYHHDIFRFDFSVSNVEQEITTKISNILHILLHQWHNINLIR